MKRVFLLFASASLALLMTGCATWQRDHPYVNIDTTYTAKSQDSRAQFLILHFTNENFEGSLKILTEGPVSSHYLVDVNPPTVYRLVDESRRAYHAGLSRWGNVAALNAASIGIEIVNKGNQKTPDGTTIWFDYPDAQMDVVMALVKDIVKRHGIRADHILGHSDIALIPWPDATYVTSKLPEYTAQLPDITWFQQKLAKYGYGTPQTGQLDKATHDVLEAFQLRFRQSKFDGLPDAETAAILDALTRPEALVK